MKHLTTLLLFLCLLNGTVFSQMLKDTAFYYNAKMKPEHKKPVFVEKVRFTSDSSYTCTLYDLKTNVIRRKTFFTNEIPSAEWEYFDEKGNLTGKKNYVPDNYKPDSKCDSAKMASISEEFNIYVLRHVKYPQLAVENGLSGKIYYRFRLNDSGIITKLSIIKSTNRFFTEEAIRIFNEDMPKSLLLKLSQKNCEVMFTMPIRFIMQQ